MDPALSRLLAAHDHLSADEAGSRVKCAVTGHEMPARADVVQTYLAGKRLRRALQWYGHDFSEFLPHVVEHKRDPKKLWCTVMRRELNKIPEEVRAHVAGRRFRNALARKEARKRKGAPSAGKEGEDADEDEEGPEVPPGAEGSGDDEDGPAFALTPGAIFGDPRLDAALEPAEDSGGESGGEDGGEDGGEEEEPLPEEDEDDDEEFVELPSDLEDDSEGDEEAEQGGPTLADLMSGAAGDDDDDDDDDEDDEDFEEPAPAPAPAPARKKRRRR